MKEKVKDIFIGIWGLIWYIATAFGVADIVENVFHINNGGYITIIAGIFTTGSFIGLFYLFEGKDNKGK